MHRSHLNLHFIGGEKEVMSMESHYYVIAGYDLTGNETDKFKDWKWSDDGEDYICNQCKGEIQFFDDPISNSYLYFGYVLASGDEYSFDTEMFDVSDIEKCSGKVQSELVKLQELGVITKDPYFKPVFKVIVFEECR